MNSSMCCGRPDPGDLQRHQRHGVATVGTNTVTWNGSIPRQRSVTITITATINGGNLLQTITNQGTISYDADGNGTNEASRK